MRHVVEFTTLEHQFELRLHYSIEDMIGTGNGMESVR